MEGADPRGLGLDRPFRQETLSWIMGKISDSNRKSTSPTVLETINGVAVKFEQRIYEKAASKEDYVCKIQQKLSGVLNYLSDQQRGNGISRPAVQSYPAQQNFNRSSLPEQQQNVFLSQQQSSSQPSTVTTMQQRNRSAQVAFSQLQQNQQLIGQQQNQQLIGQQQNQQFGQQNQQLIGQQQNQQFGQQNQQFGQQNQQQKLVQRGLRNPVTQQNSVMTMNRYRQSLESFNQAGNGQTQQMIYSGSASQHSGPLANLQGQINQFQDSRLQGSHEMSSGYFRSPNYTADNRHIPQSHMASTTAAGSDEDQFLQLVAQARATYLPGLKRRLKMLQGQLLEAKTLAQQEEPKKHICAIQQMIKTLHLPENELLNLDKGKLRQSLSGIRRYYEMIVTKDNMSVVNQAQYSRMNQSRVSTSAISPGFSYSPSTAASSPFHASVNAKEQMDMKRTMQHSVSQGAPDQNTASGTNQSPKMLQPVKLPEKGKHLIGSSSRSVTNAATNLPEKGKDLTDSSSKPSSPAAAAATPRIAKKRCIKPRKQSAGTTHDAWLNLASLRPKGRSMPTKLKQSSSTNNNTEHKRDNNTPPVSQPQTPILSVDTLSTPVTPSSGPKENENPVESAVLPESTARTIDDDAQTLEETIFRGEPESEIQVPQINEAQSLEEIIFYEEPESELPAPQIPASPIVVPDCVGLENTQPQTEKLPIDRLLDAVKSCSKEALKSGIDGMLSVMKETDKVPDSDYYPIESEPIMSDDETIFLEDMHYYVAEIEEPMPKKMRRNFVSVSRDISTPYNSAANSGSKLKPSQSLLDEMKETNYRLFETVIEVVSTDSSLDQGNGTVVRCTYNPIIMNADTKRMFATESIDLPIDFLVPFNYPISPPKILGCRLPATTVGIIVEMTETAKFMFDNRVRCVDPLTVGGMAQEWDVTCRSVLDTYAKYLGQKSSGPCYGQWERVVPDP